MTSTQQKTEEAPSVPPTPASPDDGPDTVVRAAATPQVEQPYLELGLREDEYARIRQLLDRRPTRSEMRAA